MSLLKSSRAAGPKNASKPVSQPAQKARGAFSNIARNPTGPYRIPLKRSLTK